MTDMVSEDGGMEGLWHVCFFKQKTAYEMRISDWSSDGCSADLEVGGLRLGHLDAIEQLPRDDVERQAAGVAVGIAEFEAVDGIVVEVRRDAADRDIASLTLVVLDADAGQIGRAHV